MRVAPRLRAVRGALWHALIDRVLGTEPGSLERVAFTLLLVKLSGCLTCHADSFRAMRGCTLCATHTIRRYRGEDGELINLYQSSAEETMRMLNHRERKTRGD